MTALSVNLNKIALLRNSRGRDYPNVLDYARRFIDLGVHGITIHPRPDERHVKRDDARDLARLLTKYPDVELNIEGYPTETFLALVEETRPNQCTLVPDAENQLTSDHGWDCLQEREFLTPIVERLKRQGIRSALFLDPDPTQAVAAAETGADRIELYTEEYASEFGKASSVAVLEKYRETAEAARKAGLGVNAGHDLNLKNLGDFLTISGILEVSIGHALTIECIDQGMERVVEQYLAICARRV